MALRNVEHEWHTSSPPRWERTSPDRARASLTISSPSSSKSLRLTRPWRWGTAVLGWRLEIQREGPEALGPRPLGAQPRCAMFQPHALTATLRAAPQACASSWHIAGHQLCSGLVPKSASEVEEPAGGIGRGRARGGDGPPPAVDLDALLRERASQQQRAAQQPSSIVRVSTIFWTGTKPAAEQARVR